VQASHLATSETESETRCWSGGRGITELSLCYSIVYCYNGAQWYELRAVLTDQSTGASFDALALYLLNASVSLVFVMLYIFTIFLLHIFSRVAGNLVDSHCPSVL